MTASTTPRSTASTGNLRVAFVPGDADPLSALVLNTSPDITFALTGGGYTPSIDENKIPDSRLGQRQIFSKRGSFSEDLALEYIYDAQTPGLETSVAEGAQGYLVVRRAIANETDWAAGQKATVHTVECGKQMFQPPGENSIDVIRQALYATAITQYFAETSAEGSGTVGTASVGTATVTA